MCKKKSGFRPVILTKNSLQYENTQEEVQKAIEAINEELEKKFLKEIHEMIKQIPETEFKSCLISASLNTKTHKVSVNLCFKVPDEG